MVPSIPAFREAKAMWAEESRRQGSVAAVSWGAGALVGTVTGLGTRVAGFGVKGVMAVTRVLIRPVAFLAATTDGRFLGHSRKPSVQTQAGSPILKPEATRRQLDAIRETTLRRIRGFRQEQAQSAFLSSQHTLLLVREKLDDARARQADLDSQLAQAETLMDELEILRQTKERLDVNTREVERVVRNQTALRVEVAQHAVEPQGRYFGFHIRLTAVALAVPVLFGLGLMLARAASGRSVERMPGGPKE